MEVFCDDRYAERESYDCKDECNKTKELKRAIVFKERSDHCDDLYAVTNCVELGLGACRSVSILHWYVLNTPAVVDGMDGELGFNLEAFAQNGEGLDEGLAHSSIARHHVVKAVTVYPLDHGANKVVAKAVKGSFILFGIGAV